MFDTEFNLNETEKVPNILIQEDSENKNKLKDINYFKIMNMNSWPDKTDLWCYWCCHPFEDQPVPCPINFNKETNKFDTVGIFCSWACASAYSKEYYNSMSYIYLFRKTMDPEFDMSLIKIAPSKICLKVFGGNMSIDEFRSNKEIVYISDKIINNINQYIIKTL